MNIIFHGTALMLVLLVFLSTQSVGLPAPMGEPLLHRCLERTSIRIFFEPNVVIFWHMEVVAPPGRIAR